jgi:hypothetical protein
VGSGGGKPPRFTVRNGFTDIAFLGANDEGTIFNWFRDIRIGPDINNPTIYGSAAGVAINGAAITVLASGTTLEISPTVGFRATGPQYRASLMNGRALISANSGTNYTDIAPNFWESKIESAGQYCQLYFSQHPNVGSVFSLASPKGKIALYTGQPGTSEPGGMLYIQPLAFSQILPPNSGVGTMTMDADGYLWVYTSNAGWRKVQTI